jgi:beta-xylosidase
MTVPVQNPVFPGDAPDPYVLDVGGAHDGYLVFHTGELFPMLRSTDLVHWTPAGTALSARPSWVVQSGDWHPWAPSVIRSTAPCPGASAGPCHVMYYVGLSAATNANCVAVATSSAPEGPYADQGPLTQAGDTSSAIGCGDAAARGAIDPSPFVDSDGSAYLYMSTDFSLTGGAGQQLQPTLSVVPLAPDLLHASGARTPLFSGDPGTWEAADLSAPTVEGPAMIEHDGIYHLLYSGGNWRGAYGMGYATASSPAGPFTKSPSNPILEQTSAVLGPGGGDTPVVGPRGATWLLYHARAGSSDAPRTLRIDRLDWRPGPATGSPDVPVIEGPTATPLPEVP